MDQQLLKKALEKHPQTAKLTFTAEDIRWATPQIVAEYRAQRLKCNTLADIGCGIGLQTFAFAKYCKKVYAVEIDGAKRMRAEKNAAALGIKNITFILGDALNPAVIRQLKDVNIIFCDPERLAGEEQRTVATIKPDIPQLLNAYNSATQNIALEFPPQIKSIPFDCEKEYLSLDGQLNRLTLYFGGLKRAERSAVVLPQKACLNSRSSAQKVKLTPELGRYLYEVDPAVVKAALLPELAQQTGTALFFSDKATYFTSTKLVPSPFFKNSFQIIGKCPFVEDEVISLLQNQKVGKVILRYTVDPQQYWSSRTRFEKTLTGTKTAHLFKFGAHAIVAEKFND